jgi:hypothetical protein
MFIKEIRAVIKRSMLFFLLAGAFIILANTLIQGPYVQKRILKRISDAIGYDLQAKDIELNLWKGLGISINDLSARSRKGSEKFTASSLRLTLNVKDLLAGHIIPSTLYLSKPVIELPWEKEYEINHALERFLPEKIPLFWFPGIHSLVIEKGQIKFTGATFSLEDFDLATSRINPSPLTFFIISKGKIGFRGETAGFELSGKLTPPSNDSDLLLINAKLKTENTPLNWFKWPASIPVKGGHFKTRLDIEGDPTDHLVMKGLIDLTGFKFDLIRKDKYKEFSIPEVTLDFESIIRADNVDVHPLKIKGDGIAVDLGFSFDFNNGGTPFLDLKFKSEVMEVETFKKFFPSPLLPLWLENRLFPILTSGDIKVNTFSLIGDIDRIRHMSRPENRSVMEMLFECRGFEVSGGGIRIPFKEVSADVELKDGLFRVTGLNAGFGDSLIKNAGLDIRDVFSESRFYEIKAEGDCDIKELMSQKGMDVVPLNASRYLDQLPDINGRISGNISIGYQKEWVRPEILRGDFLMKGFSLDNKEYIFPVRFDEAVIHIDDSGSDYVSGSGSWGNNSFNVSANFGIAGVTPYLKNGLIYSDVDMNQVFSVFNLTNKTPLIFSETLPWNISLAKEGEGWSVKGRVDLMDTQIKSGDFTARTSGRNEGKIIFELAIRPAEGRIDVNNALLTLKESSVNMSGAFDFKRKRPVEVRLHSSGLDLKDLSVVSDQREIFSGGVLKGDLNISMTETGRDALLLAGLMEGAGLSFQTGRNSPLVSDCSFQADFSGKGARISYCNLKAGQSSFSVTGDISGWSSLQGDIKVHSDYLDFSEILSTEGTQSRDSIMDRLDFLISIDVSRGRWRKLAFGPAEADLAFKNGNILVKDSQVHMDHGDLAIKGHVLKSPDREIQFAGDIRIKGQPVDELIEGIGINYKALKGDITIDGALSIKGREKKDLLSGLNGSVKVSMTEGLIKNPSLFIKILDFLSLKEIFKQRPPDLRGEGLYFESISGDAVIENGVLTSHNMIMRSPVMNAFADGSADIPQEHLNFTLVAQPHNTIDSLVSKVPILGYIITGEHKSVVAYPFKVEGSFSDPDPRFDPIVGGVEGIMGILKRVLLTPARIFNKINKALKNNGDKTVP